MFQTPPQTLRGPMPSPICSSSFPMPSETNPFMSMNGYNKVGHILPPSSDSMHSSNSYMQSMQVERTRDCVNLFFDIWCFYFSKMQWWTCSTSLICGRGIRMLWIPGLAVSTELECCDINKKHHIRGII